MRAKEKDKIKEIIDSIENDVFSAKENIGTAIGYSYNTGYDSEIREFCHYCLRSIKSIEEALEELNNLTEE